MDVGVPVLAAAAGTVIQAVDGNFDRSNGPGNTLPANYVAIDHGGGWVTYYYHLRKNSVAVAVGFIALAGVAAETGVVMLIYLEQAMAEELDRVRRSFKFELVPYEQPGNALIPAKELRRTGVRIPISRRT